MKHDTVAVHKFQEKVIQHTSDNLPHIRKVFYFSDGSAAQYKNFKNFSNLTFHNEEFGIAAEWHFFATSHGKSPCDGVGGTVKREVARASLQATTSGFLLTPEDLYKWCQQHISGIKFIWVGKEELVEHGKKLESRFLGASKIPGTRENHSFIPGPCGLKVSRVSGQDTHFTCNQWVATSDNYSFQQGDYAACLYDGRWWVGCVRSVSDEHNDFEVVFMHPHGPASAFKWPQREDVCWVANEHILCKIQVPVTKTGRSYVLSIEDLACINKQYLSFINH